KLQSSAVLTALNACAVATFAVLALTHARALGYVLAALTLAGIVGQVRSQFARTITAQLLVAAGILVDYQRAPGIGAAGIALGGFILATLIIDQPILAEVVDRPMVRVANLPGYVPEKRHLVTPRLLYAGNLALIAVAGVFALAGVTEWLFVALAAALAGVTAWVGLEALQLRLRGSLTEKRLHTAIVAHDPAFALHFSAPDHTEYHVEMWRPYLERIGRPWVIILREPHSFDRIAAASSVPVIYTPLVQHIDDVITPNMKAVFYVNNGGKNTHMVRLNQLTHIQLLHGDSDKASSFNPVTAMFDKIFVAGQAGIDRYEANGVLIPRPKFDIVGRPQVESVQVASNHIGEVTDKHVLYATTWVGLYADVNFCSLPIGERIVAKLIERKVTVILRPHPYADRDPASVRHLTRLHQMLADDRTRTGRQHVFGPAATEQMTLFDCINRADAMISDVSGVASDFLYSGKPFALTNMLGESPETFAASFPLSKAAYVLDKPAANIDAVLDDLLEKDPLELARRETRVYYLGDFPEAGYADAFVAAARKYV
ncbi:MAG TPA: CDP-glycerol glycerophosphotransferase family protein, partial [Micromonosporaceae bacterium]